MAVLQDQKVLDSVDVKDVFSLMDGLLHSLCSSRDHLGVVRRHDLLPRRRVARITNFEECFNVIVGIRNGVLRALPADFWTGC